MSLQDTLKAIEYEDLIKKQNFEELKQECLNKNELFVDNVFSYHKLSLSNRNLKIEWLRPKEIVEKPVFLKGEFRHDDFAQGKISDCWFMSALSCLTLNQPLAEKLIPIQSFDNDYAGIFHFKFYHFDEWIDVVIDDTLPVVNGKLALGHSSNLDEFWPSLMEKAYAKLKNNYESLNFGHANEALVDMSGGIPESFRFKNPEEFPPNFYVMLHQAFVRNSFICCFMSKGGGMEEQKNNGLNVLHVYSLTGIICIKVGSKLIHLVRLKNPWRMSGYKGPWSVTSKEWKYISKAVKDQLGITISPGEFWMSYMDLIKNFDLYEFCHLNIHNPDNPYRWFSIEFHNEWIKDKTAGGCANHPSFILNPKYILTLCDTDAEYEEDEILSTVIISVTQKYYRFRKALGTNEIKIGYTIFFLGETDSTVKETFAEEAKEGVFGEEFFANNRPKHRVMFAQKQDVCGRFYLSPGRYLIIPTTFNPGQEAMFSLKIYISRIVKDENVFVENHPVYVIPEEHLTWGKPESEQPAVQVKQCCNVT